MGNLKCGQMNHPHNKEKRLVGATGKRDELGGWATWMMGSLPNSDITPRVLERAKQFVGVPGHPWPQTVGGRPVDRLSGPRELPAPERLDCSFALPVSGSVASAWVSAVCYALQ